MTFLKILFLLISNLCFIQITNINQKKYFPNKNDKIPIKYNITIPKTYKKYGVNSKGIISNLPQLINNNHDNSSLIYKIKTHIKRMGFEIKDIKITHYSNKKTQKNPWVIVNIILCDTHTYDGQFPMIITSMEIPRELKDIIPKSLIFFNRSTLSGLLSTYNMIINNGNNVFNPFNAIIKNHKLILKEIIYQKKPIINKIFYKFAYYNNKNNLCFIKKPKNLSFIKLNQILDFIDLPIGFSIFPIFTKSYSIYPRQNRDENLIHYLRQGGYSNGRLLSIKYIINSKGMSEVYVYIYLGNRYKANQIYVNGVFLNSKEYGKTLRFLRKWKDLLVENAIPHNLYYLQQFSVNKSSYSIVKNIHPVYGKNNKSNIYIRFQKDDEKIIDDIRFVNNFFIKDPYGLCNGKIGAVLNKKIIYRDKQLLSAITKTDVKIDIYPIGSKKVFLIVDLHQKEWDWFSFLPAISGDLSGINISKDFSIPFYVFTNVFLYDISLQRVTKHKKNLLSISNKIDFTYFLNNYYNDLFLNGTFLVFLNFVINPMIFQENYLFFHTMEGGLMLKSHSEHISNNISILWCFYNKNYYLEQLKLIDNYKYLLNSSYDKQNILLKGDINYMTNNLIFFKDLLSFQIYYEINLYPTINPLKIVFSSFYRHKIFDFNINNKIDLGMACSLLDSIINNKPVSIEDYNKSFFFDQIKIIGFNQYISEKENISSIKEMKNSKETPLYIKNFISCMRKIYTINGGISTVNIIAGCFLNSIIGDISLQDKLSFFKCSGGIELNIMLNVRVGICIYIAYPLYKDLYDKFQYLDFKFNFNNNNFSSQDQTKYNIDNLL